MNFRLSIQFQPVEVFIGKMNFMLNLPGKIIIQNHNGYLFIINELLLEEYLPYVATSEMNPDCPPALLEAQTIAARSWLLANRKANHPELNIDVCNDDCCQRYQGITEIPDNHCKQFKIHMDKFYYMIMKYVMHVIQNLWWNY